MTSEIPSNISNQQNARNLILVNFAFNVNNEFINFLESFKDDYNFEIFINQLHLPPENLEGFIHRLFCFYGEKEDDFYKLSEVFEKFQKKK